MAGALGGFFAGTLGLLACNARSLRGRALTAVGAIIPAGIFTNLRIHFRTTSLRDLPVMLGLLAGGLGLSARPLGASGAADDYGS